MTLLMSHGEHGTLLVHLLPHGHLLLERGLLLGLCLLKHHDIAELLLGGKRASGRSISRHDLMILLLGPNILPTIHNLAEIGPISMKKIMREDDLTQPRDVHLPESPPLEPSRKTLELGLTETLGQDLLHELLLIGDAE